MKTYKPSYCFSLLYAEAMIFVCVLPLLGLADAAVVAEGSAKPGQLFWGSMLALGLWAAASVLFVWLISLLIGLFTRKIATVTETTITYGGKTLPLDSIRYLTLFLPEIRRFSSKPQSLSLWADKQHYMEIKRPSISLIVALKKRCVFAAFDVDDWKGRIKEALWVMLGVTAASLILFLLGVK